MAENNSTPIETTAANTIVVPVPEVGQELTVTLDAGSNTVGVTVRLGTPKSTVAL